MGILTSLEDELPNGFHDCELTSLRRHANQRIVIVLRPWLGDEDYGSPIEINALDCRSVSSNFESYVQAIEKDTWFELVEPEEGVLEIFCGIINEPLTIRYGSLETQNT